MIFLNKFKEIMFMNFLFFTPPEKIKILFVNDMEDSKTYEHLKEELKKYKGIELFEYKWKVDTENLPLNVFYDISTKCANERIDIVIGEGIGGYFAAGMTQLPKVLINPTLTNDFIRRDIKRLFDYYNEVLWNKYAPHNRKYVWMCSSSRDELYATNAYNLVNKLFKTKKLVSKTIIQGNRELTKEAIDLIVKNLINIIRSYPKLLNVLNYYLEER